MGIIDALNGAEIGRISDPYREIRVHDSDASSWYLPLPRSA
jgi:hypothetical protein